MPIVNLIATTDKRVLMSVQSFYAVDAKAAKALETALTNSIEPAVGTLYFIDIIDAGTVQVFQYLDGSRPPEV